MASKNTIRDHLPESYYHVFNQGVEKRQIFLDDQDYQVFLGLIRKFITGRRPAGDTNRHKTQALMGEVQLLAYCLMPNYFHLMLYQVSEDGVTKFMRRLATAYSMYFNNRYNRVGALFQGRFRARLLPTDQYVGHVSRYIHLCPHDYVDYPYSSLQQYIHPDTSPSWLSVEQVLGMFGSSVVAYAQFIDNHYMNEEEMLDLLDHLAGYDQGAEESIIL